MEKYFKKIDGSYVNIVKHTLEQLNKWPDLKIHISTDSQSSGWGTRYATVICYRYGTRGAHYVVLKNEVPRVKVEYMRLYDEGLKTLDAAKLLTDELPVAPILEFDFNDYDHTISSALVGVFKGYNNAVFKSGQMIATKAADHECRNSSNMFNLEVALKEEA